MRVRSLRSILLVLLALAWLPITSHCQLELVPGLAFLQCADAHDETADTDPCTDSGCCNVESAKYPTTRQELGCIGLTAVPHAIGLLLPERTLSNSAHLTILTAAPPELLASWQFLSRAAQPVRAPSCVS